MISTFSSLRSGGEQKREGFIRVSAYYFWEKRIRENEPGSPMDDWLAAEQYIAEYFPLINSGFLLHNIDPITITLDAEYPFLKRCPSCGAFLQKNGQDVGVGTYYCEECGSILILLLSTHVQQTY
jgi:hypothetical protein